MLRIFQEDDQTFIVQQDDGSVTPPIAKSDPSYTALKMQEGPSAAALFNAAPASTVKAPTTPIDPTVSANNASPQDLANLKKTLQTPAPVAPIIGEMPPAENPPAPPLQTPQAPAGGSSDGLVTIGSHTTGRSRTIIPQENQDQIAHGFETQQAAVEDLQDSYTQAAKDRDAARAKETTIRNEQLTQQQARAKEIATQEDAFTKDLQAKMNDFDNAEIKSKGVFDDKNVGQKVAAGLAIVLGAAGQALSGSKENYAIKIFDEAIKQDLEVQKANLAKKKDAVSMTSLIQDAARKAGMSKEQADAKVFEYRYGQIQSELQGVADRLTDETKKAEVMKMVGDLEAKKGEILGKANAVTVETKDQTETRPLTKAERGEAPEGLTMPEGASTEARAAVGMNSQVQDIRQLASVYKDQAGVASGKYNKLLSRFGLNSTDGQELNRRLGTLLRERVHQLSGAGSTEKEVAGIKETLPSLETSPETFERALDSLEESNVRSYYNTVKQYTRDGAKPKNYEPLPLDSKYTPKYSGGASSTFQPGK